MAERNWLDIFRRWGRSRREDELITIGGRQVVFPDSTELQTYVNFYTGNSDVFTVINKITEPASSVPIKHFNDNGDEMLDSKTLKLLANPNPYMSQTELMEEYISYFLIFGNSYLTGMKMEQGMNEGRLVRLETLTPEHTNILIGTRFEPIAGYVFDGFSTQPIPFAFEEVAHWKEFNPDFDKDYGLYGMSRLQPLIRAITSSTEGYEASANAFRNMGANGMLTIMGVKQKDGSFDNQAVTKAQLSSLKQNFEKQAGGSKNKGRVLVTNQSAEYTNFGLSPADLKVLDLLNMMSGKIADAYNVPSVLLSGTENAIYNNVKTAEKSLWTNAIKPILDSGLQKLGTWLIPNMGESGYLQADYSGVAALQDDLKELTDWMTRAGYTLNEIRTATGADELTLANMDTPLVSFGSIPVDELGVMPSAEKSEKVLKKFADYRLQ